jgi:tetratricopeptide (TPR) repeat protein
MPLHIDSRGLALTASLPSTPAMLDEAVNAYLGMRNDTLLRAAALTESDSACVLGHCFNGYLHMHACQNEGAREAQRSLDRAKEIARTTRITPREEFHIAALGSWWQGDLIGAVNAWENILEQFPLDLLSLRLAQFMTSYLGRSAGIRDSVAHVLPAWEPGLPGYGFVLGCYAYGLEEAGEYDKAETFGRQAVDLNPKDLWGAHAVTHVMEMTGRVREGIDWIETSCHNWQECGTFVNHLWWHCGLFHLAAEEYDRALDLYDRKVSAKESDEYLDIANASALLWRIEQGGADVGSRWEELAERARRHCDEHFFVFIDLHYAIAIAAGAKGATPVEDLLDSFARYANKPHRLCTESQVMQEVGLPVAKATIAHRNREYDRAADLLLPVKHLIHRMGGSHAQRDIFQQMLSDAAIRANRLALARVLLTEQIEKRPRDLWAWRTLARLRETLADVQGAASARAAITRILASGGTASAIGDALKPSPESASR